jgi:hypothetical protein
MSALDYMPALWAFVHIGKFSRQRASPASVLALVSASSCRLNLLRFFGACGEIMSGAVALILVYPIAVVLLILRFSKILQPTTE